MNNPERWEPGDIVLSDGYSVYTRSDHPQLVWADGAHYAPIFGTVPVGTVEEDYPARPLTLLVRNGQPCSGITDEQGDPCPVWAVKASLASLESQLTDMADERVTADDELLQDTLDALYTIGCQFPECEGPKSRPIPMATCIACGQIAKLRKRLGLPLDPVPDL